MSEELNQIEETAPQEINDIQSTYLVFHQEGEKYALHADIVREVFTLTEYYRIPMVPDYIKGVINLRGNIIPVLDISMLFYNQPLKCDKNTSVIILEVDYDDDEGVILGVMVDDIDEVLKISETQINHTPDFGARINPAYFSGILHREDSYLVILDASELFNVKELSQF